jgi:hypothetical protein
MRTTPGSAACDFPVSGKATAAVMVVCLALAALIVVPLAGYLEIPPWLRMELLIGVWWLIWLFALSRFLYTGHRLSDDVTMHQPRSWFRGGSTGGGSSTGTDWWPGNFFWVDAEGCLIGIGVVIAIIVAIVGFWFLIEIALPAIFALLYFLIRGMLARVVNDRHACKGNLSRSVSWALVWATLYMAPLALLAWVVHVVMGGKPPGAGS